MPVLPVISKLCPSEIFRLRSLIKGLLEEGAEMQTRSRRKAVSVRSVAGHPGVLGCKKRRDVGKISGVNIAGGRGVVLSPWGHHLWTGGLPWAELWPQKSHTEVPTPSTSEGNCIWRQGL